MTELQRVAKTNRPSARRRMFRDVRLEAIAQRYAEMIVGSCLKIRKRYRGPYEVRREWVGIGNRQEPIVLAVYPDKREARASLRTYQKLDRQAVLERAAQQARAA